MKQSELIHKSLVLCLVLSYCSTFPLLSIVHTHKLAVPNQVQTLQPQTPLHSNAVGDLQYCDICSRLQSTQGYIGFVISSPATAPLPCQWIGRDIEPYGFVHPSPLQERAPPILHT